MSAFSCCNHNYYYETVFFLDLDDCGVTTKDLYVESSDSLLVSILFKVVIQTI